MARRRAPHSTVDWNLEPDVGALGRAAALLATDPDAALRQLESLADRGSVQSMLGLGWSYAKGDGLPLDHQKAEEWYRRAERLNAPRASYHLARMYEDSGEFDRARTEYARGAEEKFVPSLNKLGMLYYRGLGGSQDLVAARELWSTASDLGHIYARRNLAILLMTGKNGVLDIPKGIGLFVSAVCDGVRILWNNRQSDLVRA